MTGEIKHKVFSPTEMLDTLDAIRDVQAEVICHIQAWLHDPRPEVDERYTAARQSEAKLLEQVMAFDRRVWNKGRPPADEASIKAEQRRRRRADQEIQRRARQRQEAEAAQPAEGEGL
jgi:hypothetical protein